jgi:hypothetical protein
MGSDTEAAIAAAGRTQPARVFISYAHDDAAHVERVREFWLFLRANGVDAVLDLPAADERQDWAQWMTRQIRDAEWILVVASPDYKRRAEGDAGPGEGRGVQWEARQIRDRIYADQENGVRQVIPVVLPGGSASHIPQWLAPASATWYVVAGYTVGGAEDLLRVITSQPRQIVPSLGAVPALPPASAGAAGWRPAEPAAPGWLLTTLDDQFAVDALEVHRPVQPDTPDRELPALTAYARREHDDELSQAVKRAAAGANVIVVLVGGSSTGKTRACWEALRPLRDQPLPWRLWHPISPSRPQSLLDGLPVVGPRTVIWLNEAQEYLSPAGGQGEQVAASLREVLRTQARGPVLVLATLWPSYWDALLRRPTDGSPDLHPQARALLDGHDITVASAFTDRQRQQLGAYGDPRLDMAARAASEGQVVQFLAGAPEQLARFRNAPPHARAMIYAAMDGRRMGLGAALPRAFLESAAPGYLTSTEWDQLIDDWPAQALDYAGEPCKGARGLLTRTRSRPGQSADPRLTEGPAYLLADYLDQHGRAGRRDQIPPPSFWTAVSEQASTTEISILARAAEDRGLLRDAAQLLALSAARGNTGDAAKLVRSMRSLDPSDRRPARWAAAVAALGSPGEVARLIDAIGHEHEAVRVLLDRDPASQVAVDNPGRVAELLDALGRAGATDQVALLARRAAAGSVLDDAGGVAALLDALRVAGAGDQVRVLHDRNPAAQAAIDNAYYVAALLEALHRAGLEDQVTALASRAVRDGRDISVGLDSLLGWLGKAGAADQVMLLAERAVAHVSVADPDRLSMLLGALNEAGAHDQAKVLARRVATQAPVRDHRQVQALLGSLSRARARDQAEVLAGRAAEAIDLANWGAVVKLLDALNRHNYDGPARKLAERAAAQGGLTDPGGVAELLKSLLRAQARDQIKVLLARNPAAEATLDRPGDVARLLGALQEARAQDQVQVLAGRAAGLVAPGGGLSWEAGIEEAVNLAAGRAAAQAPVDDLEYVAALLNALDHLGAHDQAEILVRRAAASAPVNDALAVADFLEYLGYAAFNEVSRRITESRAAGIRCEDDTLEGSWVTAQAKVLAGRAAAQADLDHEGKLHTLFSRLEELGLVPDVQVLAGRVANKAPLDGDTGAGFLLAMLLERAEDQAEVLMSRLPPAGLFGTLSRMEPYAWYFRYGCDSDASPAGPWHWEDLTSI